VWQHLRRLNPAIERNAVADLIARTCNGNGKPNRDAVIGAMHKVLVSQPAPNEVLRAFERALPIVVHPHRVESNAPPDDAPLPVDAPPGSLDDDEDAPDPFRF
jgi:hypothetical protein